MALPWIAPRAHRSWKSHASRDRRRVPALPRSGALSIHHAPVSEQMPKRCLGIPSALIEPRQIEMRVSQLRIERQGFAIRDDGVALSIQIFQQDREVENQ